jgi:TniQ
MGGLLTCRPKPKPDELFSSWLIRLAEMYRMRLSDFLQFLGIASHFHSSDIDRLAPEELIRLVAMMTGTDLEDARRTLLRTRVRLFPVDQVQTESPSWAWLIPLGHSRRSGRIAGFQFCPVCLASDTPYFRWQWSIALWCCCPVHNVLLADTCPCCAATIHPSRGGLLGAMRALGDDDPVHLARCTNCAFDLRRAQVQPAPDLLVQKQISYEEFLKSGGEGTEVIEFFAVLRHIVSLIFGENRALEEFRQVVARLSSARRVDRPVPYEPDVELLTFEEADVLTRSHVLWAANWLMEEWPARFVECCREAEVSHSALHQRAIRVRWYCEVAALASSGTGDEVMSRKGRRSGGTVYCKQCSKLAWLTRSAAEAQVQTLQHLPDASEPELLESYPCPHRTGWHVGHNRMRN